jgi:hypothetical protein
MGAHTQADNHLCSHEDRGKGNQGAVLQEKSVGNKNWLVAVLTQESPSEKST